jgi:hypothetical protein
VARAVVVLVLERAFDVGGEVVAATTRVIAGRHMLFAVKAVFFGLLWSDRGIPEF